jgi:hypothetical protein
VTSPKPPRTPGLDEVAALARGLKPVARFVAIASLIAAASIGYALQTWLQMGALGLSLVGVLLGLPALLYGWLWWLLYALGELPHRVYGAVDTLKEIRQRPAATTALRKLGRGLRDVWNVMDAADNVWLPISATILLMNPLGWMALAIGAGYAVILWRSGAVVLITRFV